MVAFGALAGLGAGAIDAGINTYAATHYSTRIVNWLHACYGIGAASGPIIMTRVLSADLQWRWGYGIVAMGQLTLAVCFAVTHKQWPASPATPDTRETIPRHPAFRTLRLPAAWLSVAAFFIYTGLEAAVGAWTYSLFTEARMIPMETAGLWVSLYWGSLTAGRLVFGLIVGFASAHLLLYFCMVSIVAGTALLWLNLTSTLSFLGLALTGLVAGPIFPSLIAMTPVRLGKAHTANGVGFEIAAAALGQALLPAAIGMLANHYGLEMIGPALFVVAIILLAVYTILSATPAERVYIEGIIPDDA
jgi:fucose permease